MNEIEVHRLTGNGLDVAIDRLAALRIAVFREWPYLYDGDMDYERRYLSKFAAARGAIIVAAFEGDTMVGAATAAPMSGHFSEFSAPLVNKGYDPDSIFYCGESILLPKWRGQGIGHRFFDEREAYARQSGHFGHMAFCSVVRPADHPMKPDDYRPLDEFWKKRGYRPISGAVCRFGWRDVGGDMETEKPMQIWMKRL